MFGFLGDFFGEFSEGIFWELFFRRIFLGGFFWEDFLGGFFWEDFFGRKSGSGNLYELICLSRFGFCQDFVPKERKEGR